MLGPQGILDPLLTLGWWLEWLSYALLAGVLVAAVVAARVGKRRKGAGR